MTPELLDVLIFSGTMGLAFPILAVSETRRARRQERKLWRQYINLSMQTGPYISWEQFRQERLPGHG